MRRISCVLLVALLLGFAPLTSTSSVSGSLNLAQTRSIKIVNSTDDLNSVRVHCLHFDGRTFFKDVPGGQERSEPNVLTGERTVVAYSPDGKVLAARKFPLVPGNEPAVIGVFGSAANEYRLDFSL